MKRLLSYTTRKKLSKLFFGIEPNMGEHKIVQYHMPVFKIRSEYSIDLYHIQETYVLEAAKKEAMLRLLDEINKQELIEWNSIEEFGPNGNILKVRAEVNIGQPIKN